MALDVWVFDVGRGLCVAVRSPNGHLIAMDCGRSEDFSPIEWLSAQDWTPHKGRKLTKLIITHPHVDHIADIENVSNGLRPFMLLRRKKEELDWKRITAGGSEKTAAMKHYVEHYMPGEYTETLKEENKADWGDGFSIRSYSLTPKTAAEVSQSDSAYSNNTSYVTMIRYRGYCFALNGDIESEGMAALLAQEPTLCSTIKDGVDFYLTSHHGHASGYSAEWFALSGPTKKFNITSERRKTPGESESATKVDVRYSEESCSHGNNRAKRRMVSTKSDGHIHVQINDDGKWNWKANK